MPRDEAALKQIAALAGCDLDQAFFFCRCVQEECRPCPPFTAIATAVARLPSHTRSVKKVARLAVRISRQGERSEARGSLGTVTGRDEPATGLRGACLPANARYRPRAGNSSADLSLGSHSPRGLASETKDPTICPQCGAEMPPGFLSRHLARLHKIGDRALQDDAETRTLVNTRMNNRRTPPNVGNKSGNWWSGGE
jgi:hypothetical protein